MSGYQKLKAPKGMPAMPSARLVQLMLTLNMPIPAPKPIFTKPDNWDSLTPAERRDLRWENWINGGGVEFASPEAQAAYKERATLIRDAVDMNRKPARVPVHTDIGVKPTRRCA